VCRRLDSVGDTFVELGERVLDVSHGFYFVLILVCKDGITATR